MSIMVPLTIDVALDAGRLFDLSKVKTLVEKILNKNVPVPNTLTQLTKSDTFSSTYTVDDVLELKFTIGSTDTKFARKIFVQDYLQYKDIKDGDQIVRYGVGVRWIVNTKTLNINADISSFLSIAASVQLGFAHAEAKFQVLGMASEAITKATPADFSVLNSDNYNTMQQSFNTIKDLIWNAQTVIEPTIIAVSGEKKQPSKEVYIEGIATSLAISAISRGRTLREVLDKTKNRSMEFLEVVRAVYRDLLDTDQVDTEPSNNQQRKAKNLIGNIAVKKRWFS